MTKKEFLAMNTPYDLKVANFNDEGKLLKIHTLYGGNYNAFCEFDYYKPICRPLSDLTKPIEHKGEKFVPMEKLREIIGSGWCDNYEEAMYFVQDCSLSTLKEKILFLPFEFIQLFISWHFDVADLISKGEAIDVNTLPENPYK